jgi:N-acetylglucosamine-6-phosphate deacetylase
MASRNPEEPAIAGLFDFQVNGFAGIDFQQDDLELRDVQRAVSGLRQHGTSRIFVTIVTDEVDRMCRRLERFEAFCRLDPAVASMCVGYHLEGPWMSPQPGFRGAHPPEPMHAPSLMEFERLQAAAGGRVKLVTLAPEWPGSAEVIAALVARGVQVALGHTDANHEQIDAAVKAGARFCTHLGNGVPQTLPRHDNVIQRLLARDELYACLIPDGIHLPPFVLQNFFRAKPAGKVLFTTDAMSGAGAPPGRYRIGRHEIDVGADRIARQPGGSGNFAGSTLTPDDGVERVQAYLGLSRSQAIALWSTAATTAFGLTP